MKWVGLTTNGSAPSARGGHAACLVNEVVYVFGGCSYRSTAEKESPLSILKNDVFALDLRSLAWSVVQTTGGEKMAPRYAHAAAVVGQQIIVFGGYNAKDAYLGDLWILNTSSMVWSSPATKGQPPPARYAHTATAVGNTVYIFGGCAEAACFRDIWALDTTTMSWSKVMPRGGQMPMPRAYHISTFVPGKGILIFGGRAGTQYYNDVHIFDIEALTWTKVEQKPGTPLPPEIAYHTGTVVLDKLYIFGGMDGKVCYNSVHVLNLQTLQWEKVGDVDGNPPAPRHKHASCVFGPCVLVISGMDAPPVSYGDMFVLEVTAQSPPGGGASGSLRRPSNPSVPKYPAQPVLIPQTSESLFVGSPKPERGREDRSVSPRAGGATSPTRGDITRSAELKRLQAECADLKAELGQCLKDLDHLSGKDLDGLSYSELEAQENMHLEALRSIASAKKAWMDEEMRRMEKKMQEKYEKQLQEAIKKMESAASEQRNSARGDAKMSDVETAELKSRLEETQGALTAQQSENMKLRRKLKAAGVDTTELGPNKIGVGVGWGYVETAEFELGQSLGGVPSMGAAPLGLGDKVGVTKERVEGYERRREVERKGVTRVPEDQRKEMLSRARVPKTVIDAEADVLEQINRSRLESLSSPTDNPLPQDQREMYSKILLQTL